jgi:hypothetical protein
VAVFEQPFDGPRCDGGGCARRRLVLAQGGVIIKGAIETKRSL